MANTITIGTLADLQVKIPVEGASGWATDVRNEFVRKIVEHNHSGENGQGRKIGAGSLANDIVTDQEIRLRNDEFLRARNAADDGDVDILKVNGSDVIELASALVSLDVTGDATVGGTLDIGDDTGIDGDLDVAGQIISGSVVSENVIITPADDPSAPQNGQIIVSNGTDRDVGAYLYQGGDYSKFLFEGDGAASYAEVDINTEPSNSYSIPLGVNYVSIDIGSYDGGTLVFPPANNNKGRSIVISLQNQSSGNYLNISGTGHIPGLAISENDLPEATGSTNRPGQLVFTAIEDQWVPTGFSCANEVDSITDFVSYGNKTTDTELFRIDGIGSDSIWQNSIVETNFNIEIPSGSEIKFYMETKGSNQADSQFRERPTGTYSFNPSSDLFTNFVFKSQGKPSSSTNSSGGDLVVRGIIEVVSGSVNVIKTNDSLSSTLSVLFTKKLGI